MDIQCRICSNNIDPRLGKLNKIGQNCQTNEIQFLAKIPLRCKVVVVAESLLNRSSESAVVRNYRVGVNKWADGETHNSSNYLIFLFYAEGGLQKNERSSDIDTRIYGI